MSHDRLGGLNQALVRSPKKTSAPAVVCLYVIRLDVWILEFMYIIFSQELCRTLSDEKRNNRAPVHSGPADHQLCHPHHLLPPGYHRVSSNIRSLLLQKLKLSVRLYDQNGTCRTFSHHSSAV